MKHIIYTLVAVFFACIQVFGQDTVKKDSASITFDPGKAIYLLDDEIDENSGLIYFRNLFWTINDSDGEPIIYGFDINNGNLQKRIKIRNAVNVDWEDICQDSDFIYVGDFGNNAGNRKDLKFYKIAKKNINDEDYQEIAAEKIAFFYEDQENFSLQFRKSAFDCEASVCFGDYIYIFTKDWKTRKTKLYQIPKAAGEHSAKLVSSFPVDGLVTAADISPDQRYLAILGYKDYVPFIWIFRDFSGPNLLKGEHIRIDMPSIHGAQTEAIVFRNNHVLYFSCEKSIEKNIILFDNVLFPQQMFCLPVSAWEGYLSSELMNKNKNSLYINNE